MDINRLQKYCERIRLILENTDKHTFSSQTSLYVSDFPSGCCGDTSEVLCTLIFDEFGIVPKLVRGTNSTIHEDFGSHVWLEIDDLVVDITMDQFNTYGFDFPPVYIGNISEFHCSFSRAVEQDARHTESRYKSVLNSIYKVVTKGLKS